MSIRDTYINFEAPETTGDWIKSILSPSSNLSRFGKKKDTVSLEFDEQSDKKQKKLIFWGLGSVLAIGLGVGLYIAFKK